MIIVSICPPGNADPRSARLGDGCSTVHLARGSGVAPDSGGYQAPGDAQLLFWRNHHQETHQPSARRGLWPWQVTGRTTLDGASMGFSCPTKGDCRQPRGGAGPLGLCLCICWASPGCWAGGFGCFHCRAKGVTGGGAAALPCWGTPSQAYHPILVNHQVIIMSPGSA